MKNKLISNLVIGIGFFLCAILFYMTNDGGIGMPLFFIFLGIGYLILYFWMQRK